MRLRTVAVAFALAASAGTPAALATTAQAKHEAAAASCVYGKIGGKTKCLRRGEFCAHRDRQQYRRYGFFCGKRDRNGDYHLEYVLSRVKPGPLA